MKDKILIAAVIALVLANIYGVVNQDSSQLSVGGNAYNSADFDESATSTTVAVTGDAQVLATSSNRIYTQICNDSAEVIYLGMNDDRPMEKGGNNFSWRLNASGGCFEIIRLENAYVGAIRASSTGSASNLIISDYKLR
ncbi:hypothetical protein KAR91_27085 [Candidatus Pacearchaeota archaeon]|nr:hypothetical protein [Candidatus Pacearchaeota archaeon]